VTGTGITPENSGRINAVQDPTQGEAEMHSTALAWRMLATHAPVTLLMDLVNPCGPNSLRLLIEEGLPDGEWFTPVKETAA